MSTSHRLLLPLLLSFATGCGAEAAFSPGAAAPSKPAMVFPTPAEIARLPSQAPRVEAFGTADFAADTWTVEEPVTGTTAYDDPSPVGNLLRDIQRPHGSAMSLSSPLRCASRELARFYLKHAAFPHDSLRRFIVARCGGDAAVVAPVAWFTDAPSSIADGEILSRARGDFTRLLETHLGQGNHEIGMAMVRDAGKAALVAMVARRVVELEAGARSVDASRRIVLRGVVHGDFASVAGIANRGDFGVSHCQVNPSVHLPKLEMTCELGEGNPWAWVEVVGGKEGQVLQEPLADVMIYEGDGSRVTYAARSYGAPAPVRSPKELTSALLDRLNALRSGAKLAPLALAARQSEENTRLAGTIFDAVLQGDAGTADRAAVGLLAGWNVNGGVIRNGYFYVGAAAPTRDATVWLDAAIERPLGRAALLDPDVRQIAIGPAIPGDAPAIGAAVTTYALYDSDDHAAQEARFLGVLAAARAERGLSAPQRVGGFDEMREQSKEVRLHGKAPMAALNDLVHAAASRTGLAVRGYVFETIDTARVKLPAELLRNGPLDVVVTVTHHLAPGAAWGQYVIFVIVVDGAATTPVTTARASSARTAG